MPCWEAGRELGIGAQLGAAPGAEPAGEEGARQAPTLPSHVCGSSPPQRAPAWRWHPSCSRAGFDFGVPGYCRSGINT